MNLRSCARRFLLPPRLKPRITIRPRPSLRQAAQRPYGAVVGKADATVGVMAVNSNQLVDTQLPRQCLDYSYCSISRSRRWNLIDFSDDVRCG